MKSKKILLFGGLIWLFAIGQVGVPLFPILTVVAAGLWFAVGMSLVLLASGRNGLSAAQGNPLLVPGMAVLAWAALGLYFQDSLPVSVGWSRIGMFALVLLFMLALNVCLERELVTPPMIFLLWSIGGLVAISALLWRWFHLDVPRAHNWVWSVSPFINIRHLAYMLVPAWVGSVFFYLRAQQGIGHAIFLTLLLAAFFWSGGRSAMLAILVFTIPLAFVPAWRARIARLLFAFPVALALSVAFTVHQNMLGFFNMLSRSSGGAVSGDGGDISSGRFSQWVDVGNYILAHPLWGYGPNGYGFLPEKNMQNAQPHNAIIQMLGEFGVVGIIPVVVIGYFLLRALTILYTLRGRWPGYPVFVVAVLGWMGYGVLAMLDGALYHAQPMVIFAAFMVLIWYSCPERERFWGFRWPSFRLPRPVVSMLTAAVLVLAVGVRGLSVAADRPEVPEPRSWRVAWTMFWPASTYSSVVWLMGWYEEEPWMARWWTQVMQDKYYRGWEYRVLAARDARSSGDEARAETLYREAITMLPANASQTRQALQSELRGSGVPQ